MARAAKAAQYDGGVSAARAQFAKVDLAMLRRGGGGGNDADVLAQRVRSRFATPLVVDGSNDGADEGDAPGAFAPFVVGGGGAEASNKSDVGQLASALDALDDALAKDDKAQAGSATERASARVVRAHVLYALGKMDDALKALERDQHDDDEHDAAWATCEMVDDDDEGRDDLLATYEPYDLVLRVVGNALKGLCLERLGKDDKLAVDAFRRAASLYEFVVGLVSSNGERDVPDVELDTWGELAMFRLAYLARKTKDVPLIFASHKLWLPASSALGKRLASNRARTEAHDERAMIVHDSYRSVLNFVGPRALERSVWRQETRANDDAHEARVRRATAIPRAGETNARYLAFLDDVAQSWRVGGLARDDAHHVARVMRDAQTHTFNSHTLVRHLARAEAALGAYDDARDLLALYRDLWQKTRETELKDVNAFLRAYRRRTEPDATKPRALSESKARESADPEKAGDEGTGDEAAAREAAQAHDGVLDDIDTERDFVQTMCFATRLCVRKLDEPATAREFADAALAVVKPDDDDRLKAAVERAQGLAKAAYAASLDGFVEDVEQRPELQTQALEHLAAAARLEPDVWENKFQLAYLLAELRDDMPAALAAAREAQDSRGGLEVAHLVALLMTAGADRQGKQAALGVLDDALARERSFVDNARGTLSAAGSRFLTTPNESTLNLANGSGGASRKPSVSPSSIRGLDVLSDDLRRKLAKMQLDRHTAGPSTPPMVPDITLDDGSLDADELSGDRDGFARDDVDVLASRLSVRLTRIQIAEAVHGPFVAAKEHDALGRWLEAELERLPLDDDDAGSTHTSTTSPPSPASTVAGSGGGRAPSKLQRPRSRPDLRGSSSSRPSSIVGVPAPTQTQHQQQQQKHSSLLHVPHLHRHRTLSRSGGGGGGGGGGGAPGATAPSSPLAGSPTSDAALSPDEREPSSRRGGQDGFEVVQSARVRKLIQLDAHELARSYDVRLARDVRTMLMSQRLAKAATLRRAGKMDEARDAIAEAERVDEHHADVWAQVRSCLSDRMLSCEERKLSGWATVRDLVLRERRHRVGSGVSQQVVDRGRAAPRSAGPLGAPLPRRASAGGRAPGRGDTRTADERPGLVKCRGVARAREGVRENGTASRRARGARVRAQDGALKDASAARLGHVACAVREKNVNTPEKLWAGWWQKVEIGAAAPVSVQCVAQPPDTDSHLAQLAAFLLSSKSPAYAFPSQPASERERWRRRHRGQLTRQARAQPHQSQGQQQQARAKEQRTMSRLRLSSFSLSVRLPARLSLSTDPKHVADASPMLAYRLIVSWQELAAAQIHGRGLL